MVHGIETRELSKKEERFCNILSVVIIIAAILAGLYIIFDNRSKEVPVVEPNETGVYIGVHAGTYDANDYYRPMKIEAPKGTRNKEK